MEAVGSAVGGSVEAHDGIAVVGIDVVGCEVGVGVVGCVEGCGIGTGEGSVVGCDEFIDNRRDP